MGTRNGHLTIKIAVRKKISPFLKEIKTDSFRVARNTPHFTFNKNKVYLTIRLRTRNFFR